ncbi:TfoX/Sxy family protein [Azoarcus olearius]|uniref:Conserved hypothetical DNA transformation protein (Competence activator) n=1 Tax=Azoarcus sp. (strain BH72) TaxID=418699 RepID=A1K7V3_AZOSB|nr:TfoX/Sxy family protein [Azoarcus olearius]CAL94908.1 conserved hypothetical DNA transformation protein (competence activator) [Azoarcus olearius]
MSEFTDHLVETFAALGAVRARRMFGGHGLYLDGVMFGLVVDDVLYLKADAQTLPRFAELGLPCFEYARNGRTVQVSYHRAPDEVLESPDAAAQWGRLALAAALRAARPAKARRPRGQSAG